MINGNLFLLLPPYIDDIVFGTSILLLKRRLYALHFSIFVIMEYKVKDFTQLLEDLAPLGSQEDYDNSGLIVGDPIMKVTGVLLSLDCTEDVVDEAIEIGANLIISHHPIIFRGLKKINGKNYVERTIIKAIKNDIAIYAAHTNLDNAKFGVNYEIAQRLGIQDPKILFPTLNTLKKLVFFCPEKDSNKVTQAIFKAGGGTIGEYEDCSFETNGIGGFTPGERANPSAGSIGNAEKVNEKRIEILISIHKENSIVEAMKLVHPYEEAAYEIYPINNFNQDEGAGMIGELENAIPIKAFLTQLKKSFNCGGIRHTELIKKEIKTIAFCGGAGSFLLNEAINQKADIYITGDFKYHEFFDAEDKIIIADIGHFESEQYTPYLILGELKKKISNFAIHLSKVNTNPINYF